MNELYIRLPEDRRGRRVHPAVLQDHQSLQNHPAAVVPGIHLGVLQIQDRRYVGDHPAAVPGIRPEVRRDPAGDRAGGHPRGSCARRAYRGGG